MRFILLIFWSFLQLAAMCQTRDLDFYIQHAKESSPTFKNLRNQIQINQVDSSILLVANKVQVNFVSNNSYAPVVKGVGYDEAITNGTNIQAVVQATRSFLSKHNIALQFRSISLQNQALLDTIRLNEHDLVRTITDQYVVAYGGLLSADYNKELYDILVKEEVVLRKLSQANVFKQTDFLSFTLTMQQQELTLLQSQLQYNTDYLTLNYLAGIVDTGINRLEQPAISDTLPYDFTNSVFYKRFITDSLRLINQKALIDFEYKPRIGAYTDGGYTSTLSNHAYKNAGFSAGVSVTIPIYDGKQKQLKYKKLDIAERTRLSNREFFYNQYLQQIAQLSQQLRGIDALVEKIQKQIKYAKTLIDANNKLLQTGDIRMTDYVLAINTYLNAKNQMTQNQISRLKVLNQINYWNR